MLVIMVICWYNERCNHQRRCRKDAFIAFLPEERKRFVGKTDSDTAGEGESVSER